MDIASTGLALVPAIGDTVGTLRVRTELLQARMKERGYKSEEAFIRKAEISRTAWKHAKNAGGSEINLEVFGKLMTVLDLGVADVFEYIPDEKAS